MQHFAAFHLGLLVCQSINLGDSSIQIIHKIEVLENHKIILEILKRSLNLL